MQTLATCCIPFQHYWLLIPANNRSFTLSEINENYQTVSGGQPAASA